MDNHIFFQSSWWLSRHGCPRELQNWEFLSLSYNFKRKENFYMHFFYGLNIVRKAYGIDYTIRKQ